MEFILNDDYWFEKRLCKLVWIDKANGGPQPTELTFRVVGRWAVFSTPPIEYKMSTDRAMTLVTPATKRRK